MRRLSFQQIEAIYFYLNFRIYLYVSIIFIIVIIAFQAQARGLSRHRPHGKGPKDPGWSPYGCHYFPDLDEFPIPRMESLPKDPLSPGEQYYLDLAGNIRKVSAFDRKEF